MKHIVKVNNIQDAKDNHIRPLIAMDANGVLLTEGKAAGPQIEFVNLGLSVKWRNALLGATNGDTAESWYGNYYAWGEIETKSDYSLSSYKHVNSAGNKLTKYCNKSFFGNNDGLTQLVPEDDVATQTNSAWRMPTQAELNELLTLSNIWVDNYDPNKIKHTTDDGGIQGLNGRVFTGKNGNTLFIPAAGCYVGSNKKYVGSDCRLWSSSLDLANPNNACCFSFYSDVIRIDNTPRHNGYQICPVC